MRVLLPSERDGKVCFICGNTMSVKYMVEVHSGVEGQEKEERPACTKCTLKFISSSLGGAKEGVPIMHLDMAIRQLRSCDSLLGPMIRNDCVEIEEDVREAAAYLPECLDNVLRHVLDLHIVLYEKDAGLCTLLDTVIESDIVVMRPEVLFALWRNLEYIIEMSDDEATLKLGIIYMVGELIRAALTDVAEHTAGICGLVYDIPSGRARGDSSV